MGGGPEWKSVGLSQIAEVKQQARAAEDSRFAGSFKGKKKHTG